MYFDDIFLKVCKTQIFSWPIKCLGHTVYFWHFVFLFMCFIVLSLILYCKLKIPKTERSSRFGCGRVYSLVNFQFHFQNAVSISESGLYFEIYVSSVRHHTTSLIRIVSKM